MSAALVDEHGRQLYFDVDCHACHEGWHRNGVMCQCARLAGSPPRPARPSGIDVVRVELVESDPVLSRLWSSDGSTGTVRRDAEIRIDTLLADARLLYVAFIEVAEDTAKPAPLDWSELSAKRVRAWVAVAREARRMHGGGR